MRRPNTLVLSDLSSMSSFNSIEVTGLSEDISTEDTVAHFQTAECGRGTVTEAVILGHTDNTSTAVNSDSRRPSTLPTNISSNSQDDRNPSYIMVSGLNDTIPTDDIVAHFQTARCGGGIVTEVIHLEQSKALFGISGIELDCEFILLYGIYSFILYIILLTYICRTLHHALTYVSSSTIL